MSYKESFFESCPSDPLGQEFAIAAGVPAKFLWNRRKGKEHNEILKGENVAQPVK